MIFGFVVGHIWGLSSNDRYTFLAFRQEYGRSCHAGTNGVRPYNLNKNGPTDRPFESTVISKLFFKISRPEPHPLPLVKATYMCTCVVHQLCGLILSVTSKLECTLRLLLNVCRSLAIGAYFTFPFVLFINGGE